MCGKWRVGTDARPLPRKAELGRHLHLTLYDLFRFTFPFNEGLIGNECIDCHFFTTDLIPSSSRRSLLSSRLHAFKAKVLSLSLSLSLSSLSFLVVT